MPIEDRNSSPTPVDKSSLTRAKNEINTIFTSQVTRGAQVSCFSNRNEQTSSAEDNAPLILQSTPRSHRQEFMSDMKEDFVDEDSARPILDFLEGATFKEDNDYSVLSFGNPYRYTGSRSSSDVPVVPEQLMPLMEQINGLEEEAFFTKYPDCKKYGRPAPRINSLLINKY